MVENFQVELLSYLGEIKMHCVCGEIQASFLHRHIVWTCFFICLRSLIHFFMVCYEHGSVTRFWKVP